MDKVGNELRIAMLEKIVKDTLWMACRYAHGRQSYAVGMYNARAREAISLGIVDHMEDGEPLFAIDRTLTAEMSGLSVEELEAAFDAWRRPGVIRTHCKDLYHG